MSLVSRWKTFPQHPKSSSTVTLAPQFILPPPMLTAYKRRVHGWLPGPGSICVFFVCSNDKLLRAERGWRGLDLCDGSRIRLCWKEDIRSWICHMSMCFLQLTFTSKEANQYFGLNWATPGLCQNSKEQRKGHGAPRGRHNHCPYFVEEIKRWKMISIFVYLHHRSPHLPWTLLM